MSEDQIQYAQDDVHYLQPLYQHLQVKIDQLGRSHWLVEETAALCDPQSYLLSSQQSWRRLKGLHSLPAAKQSIARALADWREHRAQQKNKPREWILPSSVLLEISRLAPTGLTQLHQIKGLHTAVIRNSGGAILSIIKSAREVDDSSQYETPHILSAAQKLKVSALMKKLTQIAAANKISRFLIANRKSVERLVLGERQLPLLQGWRLKLAGRSLLDLLEQEA